MKRRRRRKSPAEIRESVDLSDLLDRLGIEVDRDTGYELVARCPNRDHPDNNPSWRMRYGDERHGLHFCHSCKFGGDLYDLIQYVTGCDFPDAVKYAKKSSTSAVVKVGEEGDGMLARHRPVRIDSPRSVRPIVAGSRCASYLERRGVEWGDVVRYGVKDWPWRSRVWVPLTLNGVLVSWLARSYDGSKPKVKKPPNDKFGRHVFFGLDQVDRKIKEMHFTEGWISAIRVGQAKFNNPVAANGSALTEEQVEAVAWSDKITVWQEGDLAGREFAREVRWWLGRGREIEVVEMPDGKDPADFGPGELIDFYRGRRR